MPKSEFKKNFRTKLIAGLFVTIPLVLTLLAVKWLFVFLDGILGNTLYDILGHHYTGLGLVLAILLVLGMGTLATTVIGRRVLVWLERLMLSIPVVKSFYSTFKQLGDAFSSQNRAAFKRFVVVEYPRPGVQAFGFLTKECVVKDGGRDDCYNAVYIPTNNLYLGDVRLFRKEEVIITDMSIEEGIKIILSAGIATPEVIERGNDHSIVAHPERANGALPVPGGQEAGA